MAIKNASDLLVYKKSPANVAQVTRVRVLEATPLDGVGTIKVLNTTDGSGNNVPELSPDLDITGNTGGTLLNSLSNRLINLSLIHI